MNRIRYQLKSYNYKLCFVFVLCSTLFCAKSKAEMIYIQNDKIKIGILTDVGARMVYLSYNNSENMLLADSTQWHEDSSQRIIPSANSDFKAYNGFISWLGPQSSWWVQQDANLERREQAAVWPPDPYIIYGDFEVVSRTTNSIALRGGNSPVSGVQLVKSFTLEGNKVHISVEAKNCRDVAVQWDLWSNIRVHGETSYFVPAVKASSVRVEGHCDSIQDIMDYKLDGGLFTTCPELPLEGKQQRIVKAFLHPNEGSIVALTKGNMFHVKFDLLSKEEIHPEQGFVEIYHLKSQNSDDDILELEHHGAYSEIAPNASIHLNETWEMTEMDREASIDDCKKIYYNCLSQDGRCHSEK